MNKDTCLEHGLDAAAAQSFQSLDPGVSRTRLEQRCLFVEKYAQANNKHTKNREHINTITPTIVQNDS